MQNQVLEIILLAMVAGFIAFRLYMVLGRRTGNERTPEERLRAREAAKGKPSQAAKDNVIALPPERTAAAPPVSSAASRGLMDIKLADRNFDEAHFIGGANAAHEMIATAFAKGDRETLRPLVSDDVYRAFDSGIAAREQRKERLEFTFVGLKSSRIQAAELKGRTAEITIAFESDIIQVGYDAAGAVIEGDPKAQHTITDIWTFARDTNARDPHWKLVATSGA
jgi:predicted lipid-binding transport protein (Tim44 family)